MVVGDRGLWREKDSRLKGGRIFLLHVKLSDLYSRELLGFWVFMCSFFLSLRPIR